ncbi:MAG: 3-isopropylmalate dehydratase small subunit [Anaerolineae bacterium]|nr:3-isopropylmalate dehydratase small subunit [Anaerolineae bacterium]
MKLQGRAWKYGANVDTDAIIPARYLNVSEPDQLAGHCMEDLDGRFAAAVRRGDMIVAGPNFGCGSSREHAPLAIKAAGVSAVIAESFARIFYRNAINIGLPILVSPEAVAGTEDGQRLQVDLESGRIENLDTGAVYQSQPYPEFMMEIIEAGGLVEKTRRDLGLAQTERSQE